ncbi:MAG TPA: CocE/NonD family hydrolase [Candidatus Dormibacteraeota bacterium]|nr:CocE/NonD family hydrolase [Candidatus Dormibacteraeota bacterium]
MVTRRVIVERGVPAQMRDGVTLMADLYRPDGDGRHPVLVQRTPYDRTLVSNAASDLDPLKMALAGYVVMVQDVRGRFESEGDFVTYASEADDGHDTVQWAAEQPWSDGNVGMFGLSYMAQCCLLAASRRPPALRAIAALESPDSTTGGDRYRGGALSLGVLAGWAMSTIVPPGVMRAAQTDPSRWAEIPGVVDDIDNLDDHMRRLPLVPFPPIDDRGVDPAHHFDKTAMYEFFPPVPRFQPADIDVPTLVIAGWHDVFLQPDLDLFNALRSDGSDEVRRLSRLVVGPWAHGTPTSVVGMVDYGFRASPLFMDLKEDINKLHRRWFDARMRGKDTGIDGEAQVQIFVMGINRWRDEREWPPARATDERWHLQGGGGMGREEPGESEPSTYWLDPEDPVPTLGGGTLVNGKYLKGPAEQGRIEARDDVLLFTSRVLDAPLEVTGHVRFVGWVAPETVDTDVFVRLCDVHPDGRSFHVCDGILRLRFRDGWDEAKPLQPGEVYRVEVDMWSTAQVFLPGHRLRVQVRASDFPRYDRCPGTGQTSGEADHVVPQRNLLFHDPKRPSHLVLPVISG